MTAVHRVLPPSPVRSLDEHLQRRGGRGIDVARSVEPEAIIDELEAAGLRGRGGAGFPTGLKWRTVARQRSPARARPRSSSTRPRASRARSRTARSSRRNPYQVIEGALIAARAVGADRIVFAAEAVVRRRGRRGCAPPSPRCRPRAGPTASRSTSSRAPTSTSTARRPRCSRRIDGRYPFPRIAPPFRRGVDEVVERPADLSTGSGLSATWRWPARRRRRGAARAGRQRRDAGQRPRHHRPRRGLVPHRGHRRVAGHHRLHRDRSRAARRRRRGHHGHHRCAR